MTEAADQEAARLERDKILYHEGRTAGHTHGFSEGIEAAAQWHDRQAAKYRDLAIRVRKKWTDARNVEIGDIAFLRLAQEHDGEAWRHEHHAKMIRALAAAAPISEGK